MNKFFAFLTIVNFATLANAYLTTQEERIYENCLDYLNIKKLDCQNNNDCEKDASETLFCFNNEDTGCLKDVKNLTISKIIKCMNDCNKSTIEKVKSYFNEYAQCLNHKQWPEEEYGYFILCNSLHDRIDCGNDEESYNCLSAFQNVSNCVVSQCNYFKQESNVSTANCMRDCNQTQDDKTDSFFSDWANCLDKSSGYTLTFATISFIIFFMLF